MQPRESEIWALGKCCSTAIVGDKRDPVACSHQLALHIAGKAEQLRRRVVKGIRKPDHVELPNEASAANAHHRIKFVQAQHLVRPVHDVCFDARSALDGSHTRASEVPRDRLQRSAGNGHQDGRIRPHCGELAAHFDYQVLSAGVELAVQARAVDDDCQRCEARLCPLDVGRQPEVGGPDDLGDDGRRVGARIL